VKYNVGDVVTLTHLAKQRTQSKIGTYGRWQGEYKTTVRIALDEPLKAVVVGAVYRADGFTVYEGEEEGYHFEQVKGGRKLVYQVRVSMLNKPLEVLEEDMRLVKTGKYNLPGWNNDYNVKLSPNEATAIREAEEKNASKV
jgi:hypothetical protein